MIEPKRGCGYRKVNSLYLVGEYISVPCDRMPFPVGVCPTCGQGIHLTRGFTEIIPLKLFGIHQPCFDAVRPCFLCDPREEPAYIMTVGSKYYSPQSFLKEAGEMGISKKIPFIPKKLELGHTIVYLAHPKAVEVREPLAVQQAMSVVEDADKSQLRLLDSEQKPTYKMGIFCAFIPQRIEMLVKESELTDEKRGDLAKRNITPIPVPDGDEDHK